MRLQGELLENEKLIDTQSLLLQGKEYELYRFLNQKKTGNLAIMKEKELKSAIIKVSEQITLQKGLIIVKETRYKELARKRENLENQIARYNTNSLGASLYYLFNYYVFEVNNMKQEYLRKQNLNNLKQKDIKISKLIEQVSIRDEYIANEKKELEKKRIKILFDKESNIKSIAELNIERNFASTLHPQHQELPVQVLPTPITQRTQADTFMKRGNQRSASQTPMGCFDYSGYDNPNIIKDKKRTKTKTTEIIAKSKKSELSQLKLNMLNDLYKNSKVVYVSKQNLKSGFAENKNVIAFDTRILNKSQTNVSIHSNLSTNDHSNSILNIKERAIDHKIMKLIGKRRSPFMK